MNPARFAVVQALPTESFAKLFLNSVLFGRERKALKGDTATTPLPAHPPLTPKGLRSTLSLARKERTVMTGIQFLTDEKGRKVAVQIDLRKYGALWEDFYDGLVSERRRKEKGVPFAAVKADLIKRGRLRG
jgi:hypothetical protein